MLIIDIYLNSYLNVKHLPIDKLVLILITILSLNTYAQNKETPLNIPQTTTTTIGNQIWTTSNLNVSHFRNGDSIPEVTSNEQWQQAWNEGTAAWCYYEYNEVNGVKYGKLYNWYAITDARGLAPKGWHIPLITEWDTLINYLGKNQVFGKVVDKSGWMRSLSQTSNASGLSILAGGMRSMTGFAGIDTETHFWAYPKDVKNYSNALIVMIGINSAPGIDKAYGAEKDGTYVRCVKD